jgi:hypothetical protein
MSPSSIVILMANPTKSGELLSIMTMASPRQTKSRHVYVAGDDTIK